MDAWTADALVLVIGAELKKATIAAEPVVLDTAEATANVVRQLLRAKVPVAVDFEASVNGGFTIGSYGQDAARRAYDATLSAAAVGGETELSERGRIVAHIEQRVPRWSATTPAALAQRRPRAAAQLLLLLVLLPPVVAQGRAKRARRRRARAREGEPEDRERLGGHRAMRI